ncbi:MAG: glycosyl hydrolase 115 family protein, partial [bacterium]
MKNIIFKKPISLSKNAFGYILFFNTIFILNFFLYAFQVSAGDSYVSSRGGPDMFPLVAESQSVPLCVSSRDYPGVLKVAKHLQWDITQVTGIKPKIITDDIIGNTVVIIGTIGKNPVIDKLIVENKINAQEVAGRWDNYALQTVVNPMPDVDQALVIFGSNKRGTIYGMYDLSSQIGISPWYWWADVPAKQSNALYVKPGFYSPGEPKVKYRGIFINDELPALSNWAKETFGGFNHKFYEKVFELILRNKGNFLWPAMWPPIAFFDDDPENPRLADELGIIISTSHHEPMMRSHEEWYRYGEGEWNYETNNQKLQEFWRGGIERMGNKESLVTVGMRGDGDKAMSQNTAIDLLKKIIFDQRTIIADVTGKPAPETPQVWAIYKEVQDYYDKGMRVDDDILILLCDDNWGNIRYLPKKEDLKHKGGYGIYYHFDFVGGPISYKWLNVTQIEHVWEQMNLAYQWGARQLWVVNVGDLKPMELPISFFLDFAWNPNAITNENLPNYYTQWAAQQFGDEHALKIGEILALYTKYNARRTPESLDPFTYSITNYREADRIVEEYKKLAERAQQIYHILPERFKTAYYQLVLFPVLTCSNVNEMIVAAGKNQLYAIQGRISANTYAEKVKELFSQDAELTRYFHEDLQNGKWNHMMSQTHLGYTYWNNPPLNKMPAVSWVQPRKVPELGYVIENGPGPWFEGSGEGRYSTKMPIFDPIN